MNTSLIALSALVLGLATSVGATAEKVQAEESPKKSKALSLEITARGFKPNEIKIKAGEPVTLKVKRTTDATCAKSITIPEYGIKQDLKELGKEYTVAFTPKTQGKVKFGCSMDQMVAGWLIVQ